MKRWFKKIWGNTAGLTWLKRSIVYLKRTAIVLFVGHLVAVAMFAVVPVFLTPLMVQRWFEYIGTDTKIYSEWTPLSKISDNAKEAVICSEDHLFDEHFGFDLEAIEKAIDYNKKHKKKRGASTISQQVAKNVFLWQGRNFIRKGLEVYFTLLIETCWSKERILEVYLNVAETGKGIFGVTSASKIYFKKTPDKLSREEAALIAAILPNPIEYSAVNPSKRIVRRKNWIIRQMGIYQLDKKFK